MESREDRLRPTMIQFITNEKYENGTKFSGGTLSSRQNVQSWLEDKFHIMTKRSSRVILVEDLGEYKIFIQIPNSKSESDFNVWYSRFRKDQLSEVRFPKHDYMFDWYKRIREDEENVFNAVEKLIKNREAPEHIASQFKGDVKEELHKFLATLKWICLQEDANYPPPNMGSMYTLGAYVLVNYGFESSEIRRLLRFI